ncbi:MAG: type VII toxin-antitoxin system MntA family adenylyltransferase antitoxin [Clostridium sp.]
MEKESIIELLKGNKIKDLFKKYEIENVLLFGSVITPEFHEYSDVDIALLRNKKIDIEDSLEIELTLTKLLNREIDLIDLKSENLDIFVKINILNNGIVIYSNDEETSLEKFKEETEYEYRENENFFYFRRRDIMG